MYSIWQTYQLMGVQINLDYLLIKNSKPTIIQSNDNYMQQLCNSENIYGEKKQIKISDQFVICNFGHDIIEKLITLCKKHGSLHEILYHTSELHHDLWKKKKINEGPYEIIHLIKKKGMTIYTSDQKHSHQTTPKIIINGFGIKYVMFDKEGKYGVTDTPFVLLTDNENIYNILQSPLWSYIVNTLGILGNNLNERIFSYVPNFAKIIESSGLDSKTLLESSEIFTLLGFTNKEKDTIMGFNNNNVQNLKLKDRC